MKLGRRLAVGMVEGVEVEDVVRDAPSPPEPAVEPDPPQVVLSEPGRARLGEERVGRPAEHSTR